MQVSIRECPACHAPVMGDEQQCNACGAALEPAPAAPPAARPAAPRVEDVCPRCGVKVPRGVLRCRDCGAYMSSDVEAAALARLGTRTTPGAAFGTAFVPSTGSSFAEVADDADFDLNPGMEMLDPAMRAMVEGPAPQAPGTGGEDDFELGDGTGAGDYAVAESGTAVEEPAAETAAPAAPANGAPAETAEAPPGRPPAPDVAHSVQTGGDVLLDAALAEETESAQRQKFGRRRLRRSVSTAQSGDSFLIFCPNGHRIQVQARHRGRTGRCPNCKSLFFVPAASSQQSTGEAGGTEAQSGTGSAVAAAPPTGYGRWITEVRLHRVNPAKLKLKPGSLLPEYEPVDLGAGPENLLVAVLFTGGGPFRAMQEPKKKAAARQAMLDHLGQGLPPADLPIPRKLLLTTEQLQQLKIVQPSIPGEESLFADVPVFGEGRVAVRIPAADVSGERAYLSFGLSQFRAFSQLLGDAFGLADFGAGTSIPMTDETIEATCHYSETVLHSLKAEGLEYYKADPALPLVVLGRRCEKCGLVVSEDSRKKEKIGGKTDSSIAKATCPKCKAKFGNITLYGLKEQAAPATAAAT